jgi:hypothetical protein
MQQQVHQHTAALHRSNPQQQVRCHTLAAAAAAAVAGVLLLSMQALSQCQYPLDPLPQGHTQLVLLLPAVQQFQVEQQTAWQLASAATLRWAWVPQQQQQQRLAIQAAGVRVQDRQWVLHLLQG